MTTYGKERFDQNYQDRVGWYAREELHTNSKELVEVLNNNNVITDNMNVIEIGSGGCRNLKYINDENSTINLFANDLWKENSMKNMHESVADKIIFYETDTLTLIEEHIPEFEVGLLISSDHLMHVEKSSVEIILDSIRNNWKPEYILIREVKEEHEDFGCPRLYHNYDIFNENYDIVEERTSGQGFADGMYFIRLYKRK